MPPALIFDVQRFSVQDGPGIRTTVFLKGCPLSCFWCHNPESQSAEPEVVTVPQRCIRCGAHLNACPRKDGGGLCDACGRCVDACPTGARQMIGRPFDVEELTRLLLRDRPFYEESGGGVTFSGGEPLLHPEFLLAALGAARREDLHTVVDTCGFAPRQDILAVAGLVDLFLVDLKLINDERHRLHTGVSNALILENLSLLAREHGNLLVRIPVIPGINDDDEAAEAAAAFLGALPGVRTVELLPYHGTGEAKAARLGRRYPFPGLKPPSGVRLAALVGVYAGAGLSARVVR